MKDCLHIFFKILALSVVFITSVIVTQILHMYSEISFLIYMILYLTGIRCFRNSEFLVQIITGVAVCLMETFLLENIDFLIDKLNITHYMLAVSHMICIFVQFLSFVTSMIIEYINEKKNKKQEEK